MHLGFFSVWQKWKTWIYSSSSTCEDSEWPGWQGEQAEEQDTQPANGTARASRVRLCSRQSLTNKLYLGDVPLLLLDTSCSQFFPTNKKHCVTLIYLKTKEPENHEKSAHTKKSQTHGATSRNVHRFLKNLSSVRGQRGSGNWVSLAGITLCWVVLDNQVCFTDLHIYSREGIC